MSITFLLFLALPVKFASLDELQELIALFEVHGQIGGQDSRLDDFHDLAEVVRREGLEGEGGKFTCSVILDHCVVKRRYLLCCAFHLRLGVPGRQGMEGPK